MTTRVLTNPQIERIRRALSALAGTLNQLGFPWPVEAQDDLKAAYEAIGLECPFKWEARTPDPVEEAAKPPPPSILLPPGRG